jgi:hypothetical protein
MRTCHWSSKVLLKLKTQRQRKVINSRLLTKSPVVKEIATEIKLPRKPADVVACVHSFNCLVLKFRAVSLTLF